MNTTQSIRDSPLFIFFKEDKTNHAGIPAIYIIYGIT